MTNENFDICIVGAGAAGLSAALAFAREGYSVAIAGAGVARRDGRSVALLDGSVRLFERLGVWDRIEPQAAPLEVMRLVDDTDNLFRAPTVDFHAREIGLDAFGWNVENATLVEILAQAAMERSDIARIDGMVSGVEARDHGVTASFDDGRAVHARLLVAADGRNSFVRRAVGVGVRQWRYPQAALTTILAHEREHREVSTEFHTRHGPFTLVPLPGRRCSLVWVTTPERAGALSALDDAALARAVEKQAHSLLGKMTVDGPRGVVPMSGLSVDRFHTDRIAFVGEAAHVFPPIGAQGLNLGLRDVASLRDAAVAGQDRGEELGSASMLRRYERDRRLDVRARTAGVDMLNRTLLSGFPPADLLRGAGLRVLSAFGPLRRFVMREGVTPHLSTPQLMRRDAAA
ncbi:MAG: UbiH/UbiF family hydroxylase [Salinarimonadaceae bacterium]|nr:MAG: UbiH/UbiF family hydroxylase [Salinarimonadaceae bacterium]